MRVGDNKPPVTVPNNPPGVNTFDNPPATPFFTSNFGLDNCKPTCLAKNIRPLG